LSSQYIEIVGIEIAITRCCYSVVGSYNQ